MIFVGVLLPKKDRERLERIAKRQSKKSESKLSDVARTMLLERVGLVRVAQVFTQAREEFKELRTPRQLTILDAKG